MLLYTFICCLYGGGNIISEKAVGIAGRSKQAVAVHKPPKGGCVRIMQASRGSAGSTIIVLCMLASIPRTASQQVQCHTTDGDLRCSRGWGS